MFDIVMLIIQIILIHFAGLATILLYAMFIADKKYEPREYEFEDYKNHFNR